MRLQQAKRLMSDNGRRNSHTRCSWFWRHRVYVPLPIHWRYILHSFKINFVEYSWSGPNPNLPYPLNVYSPCRQNLFVECTWSGTRASSFFNRQDVYCFELDMDEILRILIRELALHLPWSYYKAQIITSLHETSKSDIIQMKISLITDKVGPTVRTSLKL